jgi:hypothetical protein
LADSTHPARHRAPLPSAAIAVALALFVAIAGHSPAARADGDPASDFLAAQAAFVPADGSFPASQQAQLEELLATAQRRGYPIRVAVIATPTDLGSVSGLWRNPAGYARFLGQELPLVFRGTLLVVMPNGFGVTAVGPRAGVPVPGAGSLPPATRGESMLIAAIAAVRSLAAAVGRPLPAPATVAIQGGASGSWLESVDAGSWLALAVGAAVIAAAWAASWRARPPARLRRAR